MASDSNGLRNQIFGKVAHLVVSERGLAKIDDPIKADSEFRIVTNLSNVVNQQMVSSRIADVMVIEVFVNNKQASAAEVQDLLIERWHLTWHRMGRTGVQAWTGLYNNSIEKTVSMMLRRVAVNSRMTQTIRLIKRAMKDQYEVTYRILQGASTLHFGATDAPQSVIFHGHEGHLWWHINNQASLSFTLSYRSTPWIPRSLPTHIIQSSIIDNYAPGASSLSPAVGSASQIQASPLAPPTSSSAPRHPTGQSPSHHFSATRTSRSPSGALQVGISPQHPPPSHPHYEPADEYAAVLPQPTRTPSGKIHGAYFGTDAPSTTGATYSHSLPKQSFIGDMRFSPTTGIPASYQPPSHFLEPPTSPRSGSSNGGSVTFGGNPPAAAFGLGSMLGNSPDRVPGSSPPTSSDRPQRIRSSSTSTSQILSGASTSISPYRVDLTSTMTKSPPTHNIGLPMDMIGPARPPSSGKLPITFGGNPSQMGPAQSHLSPVVGTTSSTPVTTSILQANNSSSPIYRITSPYISSSNSFNPELSGVSLEESQRTGSWVAEEGWNSVIKKSPNLPPTVLRETPFISASPYLTFEKKSFDEVVKKFNEIAHFVPPSLKPLPKQ